MADHPMKPPTDPAPEDEEYQSRTDYRAEVKAGRDDAQESYDKGIITVSGGALAIAFGFVKASAGDPSLKWLIASWGFFALSLLSTLASFQTSHRSFDKLVREVDAGVSLERLRKRPGGWWTTVTHWLNQASLVFLLLGIIALGVFVASDRGQNEVKPMNDQKPAETATPNRPAETAIKDYPEKEDRGKTPTAPPPARVPSPAGGSAGGKKK